MTDVEITDEFQWRARTRYNPQPGAKALLNDLLWRGIARVADDDGRWSEEQLLTVTGQLAKKLSQEQWEVLAREAIDHAMREFTHRNQPKIANGVVRYDIESSLLVLGNGQRVYLKNATANDLQVWLDIRRVDAERKQAALGYESRWVKRVQTWLSQHPEARSFVDYHQEVITPMIGVS